ncbi:MAG: hypothetical protein QNJ77_02175 [Acidimicrobiia bacterium]|nr:hypothetical protein [Acidimicrobiia bacterium]
MIEADAMHDLIRAANPVADPDQLEPDELARFVALAQAALLPSAGERSVPTDLLEFTAESRASLRSGRLSRLVAPRLGPAVAVGIAAVLLIIVGVATLLLRADGATTPPAITPPSVTTTLPTQPTTEEEVLAPEGFRMEISTVVGDLEFVRLGALGRSAEWIYIPEATPYGLVALEGDTLWWSTDYLTWQGAPVPYRVDRVSVVGSDVVVHGDQVAARWVWNGETWAEANQLDVYGVQLVTSGPHGTAVATYDKVLYSSDGQQFTEASSPPTPEALALAGEPQEGWGGMAGGCSEGIYPLDFEDSEIGSILAAPDGFVALTAAHPLDWGKPKICEPIPWFSSDGDTWVQVATESPFGENAAILPKVTERNGRFVAVGSTGPTSAAIWVSDDGLDWARVDLEVDFIDAVAAGELGWMITGVVPLVSNDEDVRQVMLFSADGITWDGPYDRPDSLTSGYLPPQLAVGPDAFFGIGGRAFEPVLGRLQDLD